MLVVPIQVRYGWRASFHIFAMLGVAWAAVWFIWFRNSPAEKRGVPSSEFAEIAAEPAPSGRALPWGVALRSGNFWAIMMMGLSYGYGLNFFVAWLHTYLVRARGFSEKDLLFSTLPFLFGACTNLAGGMTGDFLLKRVGLRVARRTVGMIGLGSATLFTVLAALSSSKSGALVFLTLSYSGVAFNQPMIFPTCIDVARKFPGSMGGASNTAVQVGSFLSSVAFGYLVKASGNYNLPLFLMAFMLGIGALIWLKIDPTLVPEGQSELAKA